MTNGKFKLEADMVLTRAHGRWEEIFTRLAPELGQAMSQWGMHVACPVHGGTNGFRLVRTHRGVQMNDGQGICNTCDAFEVQGRRTFLNGIGMLMWIKRQGPKHLQGILKSIAEIVAPDLLNGDRATPEADNSTTRYRGSQTHE